MPSESFPTQEAHAPFDAAPSLATLRAARQALLAARDRRGAFVGELSGSALSTAVAVLALRQVDRARSSEAPAPLVASGLSWLVRHQNEDGGYGDTITSPSNISTTALCWVALGSAANDVGATAEVTAAERRTNAWLDQKVGGLTTERLKTAIAERYGEDLTFSVPILTTCVLGGRFTGKDAWKGIPHLPFEIAACPRRWFSRLGIPMVSYALPALIALGQVRHHFSPTRNPITRALRALTLRRTLATLEQIQPDGGGFLEAAPLTSFVMLSLASMGHQNHAVVLAGERFLRETQREDGCWPIDTNLDTWTTTLAVKAMAGGASACNADPTPAVGTMHSASEDTIRFLLGQQYLVEHPYTLAAPGGFAWTDLPGGVPDADDTAGALLALHHLTGSDARPIDPQILERARLGVRWLLGLQNRDGGIPTFCRGFGKLPFDRSAPDLTAHALRALEAWGPALSDLSQELTDWAIRAMRYLERTQESDGSWIPLWFGNQRAARDESPLYGTTQVVRALATGSSTTGRSLAKAVDWLLGVQNEDGGFGAAAGVPSSIEETGLALEALAAVHQAAEGPRIPEDVLHRAMSFLVSRTSEGSDFPTAPIGLYFAKLWYSEQLYPVLFTVGGMERACATLGLSPRGQVETIHR